MWSRFSHKRLCLEANYINSSFPEGVAFSGTRLPKSDKIDKLHEFSNYDSQTH